MSLTSLVIPPWVYAAKYVIILSLIAGLGVGIYMKGRHDVQVEWDLQKARDRAQVAMLQAKSAQVTTKIVTQYVDRIKTITVKGDTIVKYIHDGITESEDAKYKLPNNFVDLYNASVDNTVPTTAAVKDTYASPVKLSDATAIMAENNTTCIETQQQLISLQSWVKQQELIFNGK